MVSNQAEAFCRNLRITNLKSKWIFNAGWKSYLNAPYDCWPMMVCLISGFLGSGKTTLLIKLAKRLENISLTLPDYEQFLTFRKIVPHGRGDDNLTF